MTLFKQRYPTCTGKEIGLYATLPPHPIPPISLYAGDVFCDLTALDAIRLGLGLIAAAEAVLTEEEQQQAEKEEQTCNDKDCGEA